ncbi:MAG TPA: hypothetical protein VHL34_11410 [Rhizomicrobium sp.]|jgi:hypothetical protein|nr:hypothetical protein [Rhizomicrobium sp.]
MPSFDFLYRKSDGSLAVKLTAECADHTRAKVLAHAMKAAECHHFEVWEGPALVYERPEPVRRRMPEVRLTA